MSQSPETESFSPIWEQNRIDRFDDLVHCLAGEIWQRSPESEAETQIAEYALAVMLARTPDVRRLALGKIDELFTETIINAREQGLHVGLVIGATLAEGVTLSLEEWVQRIMMRLHIASLPTNYRVSLHERAVAAYTKLDRAAGLESPAS